MSARQRAARRGAVAIELSDEEVAALDQAVPAEAVVGGRYREAEMAWINS